MNIKKGDNVIILAGKDKGRKGKVIRVFPKKDTVVVEGINMRKRHKKAKKSREKGQVIEMAVPLHISNIALVDPKTGKPTRIGTKIEKGKKVRVARKSGTVI